MEVGLAVDHHVWGAADALEAFLLVGMEMRRVQASGAMDEQVEFIDGPSCPLSYGPDDHAAAGSVLDYLTETRALHRSACLVIGGLCQWG